MNLREDLYRPDDALLAGVCAEIARRLGWNVWAIRLLFVVGLFIHAIAAGAVYLIAAVVMGLLMGRSPFRSEEPADEGLHSEHLESRNQRIQELEEKFRALDRERR